MGGVGGCLHKACDSGTRGGPMVLMFEKYTGKRKAVGSLALGV